MSPTKLFFININIIVIFHHFIYLSLIAVHSKLYQKPIWQSTDNTKLNIQQIARILKLYILIMLSNAHY